MAGSDASRSLPLRRRSCLQLSRAAVRGHGLWRIRAAGGCQVPWSRPGTDARHDGVFADDCATRGTAAVRGLALVRLLPGLPFDLAVLRRGGRGLWWAP